MPPGVLAKKKHTMKFDPIYRDLDEQIDRLAQQTGQRCPPDCGACCQKPSAGIEASPAELRPLARHLWETGDAEAVLEAARTAGAEGWCVLHRPGSPDGEYARGRCGYYGYRPLTCRLFGYAALPDKAGRLRPTLSAVMKRKDPEVGHRFDQAVAGGAIPPVTAAWRFRMAEADPEAASDLLPLNQALIRALEAEGLVRRLGAPSDRGTTGG